MAIQSQALIITMHKQKVPICKLSLRKAPKHGKFKLTDIREKPVDFILWCRTGVDLNFPNYFANLSSFAKVSFSVESATSWSNISNY